MAQGGELDQGLDALDVEGFEVGADVDELGVFFGSEGFGLAFVDELVVLLPGFRGETEIDLLEELGFGGGCGVWLEAFLEGVEDEAIGV